MTDVPPREPNAWPTPQQFVAEWNQLTPAEQHARATQILDCMQAANTCDTQRHRERLGSYQPLNTTRARTMITCPDCDKLVDVPIVVTPRREPAHVELRISVPEDEFAAAFAQHVLAEAERHPTFVISQ